MAESTILDIMVAQHALIEALFTAFKDELNSSPERAKSFLAEFSWESKKHFFIEEEAIFNFLPWKDSEISVIVTQIKAEHIAMVNKLDKMAENLAAVSKQEMEDFYKLLTSHRALEEQKLYPKLDAKLIKVQRNQIVQKIKEIPFGPGK